MGYPLEGLKGHIERANLAHERALAKQEARGKSLHHPGLNASG
jgi:hypothetical protein